MKWLLSLLLPTLLIGTSPVRAGEFPKPAPDWQLKDLDGKPVDSAQFKGKVILLDFWATWCPPCREEIPGLIELQKEFGPKGFTIIGVSLDDDPAAVKKFQSKVPINYPVVMGDGAMAAKFGGVEAIPTKFLVDREGKIVSRSVGGAEKADLEKLILPLLAKP